MKDVIDVNVRAKWHICTTPLHFAAYKGSVAIVQLLLENGADPNARDGSNKTPYDIARRDNIKKLLMTH